MKVFEWLFGRSAEAVSPQQFLATVQRDAPPIQSAADDRGRQVYRRLGPRLSPAIRELFEKNEAVIGEVGILTPNALAEFVPPRGYVVRVYSGLGFLFHTVSRMLMTSATVHTESGTQGPIRTQDEATNLIARVCSDLKRGVPVSPPGDFGLTAAKLEIATRLAEGAEDFVVAHELGHIAEWKQRGGDPGEISPEEEYAADRHALGTVLGVGAIWPVQKRLNRRDAYAGAEFALRIFGSLEHLDYPFETTHPLPGGRLQKLRESARALFGSRFRYMEVSTIAFSWDQQLEEMERKIAGEAKAAAFVVGLTADRLLSSLSVIVEATAKGQMAMDSAASQMTHLVADLNPELRQEIASQAVAMYEVEALQTAHLRNVQLRSAEVEAFKVLKTQLPDLFPVGRRMT